MSESRYVPYRIAVIACAAGYGACSLVLGVGYSATWLPHAAGTGLAVASLVLLVGMFGALLAWLGLAGAQLRRRGLARAHLRLTSVWLFAASLLVLCALGLYLTDYRPPGTTVPGVPSPPPRSAGIASDMIRTLLAMVWVALTVAIGRGIDRLSRPDGEPPPLDRAAELFGSAVTIGDRADPLG